MSVQVKGQFRAPLIPRAGEAAKLVIRFAVRFALVGEPDQSDNCAANRRQLNRID